MEHITVCIHDCKKLIIHAKFTILDCSIIATGSIFLLRCDGFVHHLDHDLAAFHALVSVSHTDGSDTTTSGGSVCS